MSAAAIRLHLRYPPGPGGRTRVHLGRGLEGRLAGDLARRPMGVRYALVSDPTVAELRAAAVERALRSRGLQVDRFLVPAGEAHKSRATKADLEDRLVAAGIGRDAAILALGGGVVGDLAGFVAATYHRGIPWAHLPTTLLAMVDASIGGKTGVDLPAGKNLVGAFHPPRAVWSDLTALDTLPEVAWRGGFAEILKAALVADADLVAFLEANAAALRAHAAAPLRRVVEAAIRVKIAVVQEDPREAGRRAILNFGHTVGHALEAASGYRLAHGEAVAIGLIAEARLSAALGLLPEEGVARVRGLVEAYGLPAAIPRDLDPVDVVVRCALDKKARAGVTRCTLLRAVGEAARSGAAWTFVVPRAALLEVLAPARGAGDA